MQFPWPFLLLSLRTIELHSSTMAFSLLPSFLLSALILRGSEGFFVVAQVISFPPRRGSSFDLLLLHVYCKAEKMAATKRCFRYSCRIWRFLKQHSFLSHPFDDGEDKKRNRRRGQKVIGGCRILRFLLSLSLARTSRSCFFVFA